MTTNTDASMYELTSTDLTNLGGPMGTESTSENFHKLFASLESAKSAAERDYNQSRGPIKWKRNGRGWTSGDLGYVMYDIEKVRVEP